MKRRSWPRRILDLRHALGWTRLELAPFLDTTKGNLDQIEWRLSRASKQKIYTKTSRVRHTRVPKYREHFVPSIHLIALIRRLERIFKAELKLYRSNTVKYDRIKSRDPVQRPVDEADYETLGGAYQFRHFSPEVVAAKKAAKLARLKGHTGSHPDNIAGLRRREAEARTRRDIALAFRHGSEHVHH